MAKKWTFTSVVIVLTVSVAILTIPAYSGALYLMKQGG